MMVGGSMGLQCPVCGSGKVSSRAPFEASQYRVIHCRVCRHEAVRPLPTAEQLREFYRSYPTTKTESADLGFLVQRSLEFFDDFVAKAGLRHARLRELEFLEIGFGNGASLLAAAKIGLRAHGIDLDPAAADRVRANAREHGVRVECRAGAIDTLGRDRRFHIVKASQIIEHTLDPAAFIAEIGARQPAGGYLIIECPNNDGAFWRLKNLLRRRYGRMSYFNSLKIGEHLSGFTRRSVGILLDRAGYTMFRCRDYPLRHRWLQPENLLWYPSLADGIRQSLRTANSYPVLKAMIPIFDQTVSACAGLGTHLAVWAQKR